MQFFIETSFFGISVIAGYGGTRQVIRKTVEGDDLFEKVQLKDLISEDEQARVLIQMTNGLFSWRFFSFNNFFYENLFFSHRDHS